MDQPRLTLLGDGSRLRLSHGPIDVVVEAWGEAAEVAAAYGQAARDFQAVLPDLLQELSPLRQPLGETPPVLRGPVARRMLAAVWPHRAVFVTPMAAVAGAVADHLLERLARGRRLSRAYVNDGGDVAFGLAQGQSLTFGHAAEIADARLADVLLLAQTDPARGLATSSRGRRSLSFGIADAVTVLAASAAAADAAATLIGNAVDLDHPAIRRRPACALDPTSDLGERLVTVEVGALEPEAVAQALANGARLAQRMLQDGLLDGACLRLDGQRRVVGTVRLSGRTDDHDEPEEDAPGGARSAAARPRGLLDARP